MGSVETPLDLTAPIDAADLADLMASFNHVTARLESTHRALKDEVARLQTELHEANREIERSRRLAALGEMAAGIAHEVRNPLGSIGLYAQMLREDLADQAPQRELAERIGDAVRGLDAIVNDVLVFSREVRLRRASVDADAVVDGAIARCADLLSGDEAPEVIRCGTEVSLEADTALLVQALTNVLRNAIEAACEQDPDHGGRVVIRVRTSAEVAGEGRGGPMVGFRVEDSGPGVDDAVLDRMFNPFFTTRAAGTGLGLPIVHRIVDAHGGRVQVTRSDDLGGACFELLIPARSRRRGSDCEAFANKAA